MNEHIRYLFISKEKFDKIEKNSKKYEQKRTEESDKIWEKIFQKAKYKFKKGENPMAGCILW